MKIKANKSLFLLFFIVFQLISFNLFSQKEYFQQRVNYTIDVALNDTLQLLRGNIKIKYFNNSPDTLHFIYMHLWPNAYSNEKTAFCQQNSTFVSSDFYFSSQDQKGFITNLDFTVDSVSSTLIYDNQNPDIGKLVLNKPLLAGDSILIQTPFVVKIPDAFSRMGRVGQSYYISQWYPKPAVYDNRGWHAMPYLDLGEFYSEFGSFDVTITLPESYFVASTGVLQTQEEVERIEKRIQDTKLGLVNETTPILSNNLKTIRYYQDSIHDFAWFADKHFLIDKSFVKLPASETIVNTYTFYHHQTKKQWSKAFDYVNNSVWFYSDQIGLYPYQNCTAVEGLPGIGGGMEYPMITLIGPSGDDKTLERTIIHEVAHNWCYGILAFNEREHSWLDEGFTSFFENEYMKWRYPDLSFLTSFTNLSESKVPNIFGIHGLPQHYIQFIAIQYLQSRNINQRMTLSSEKMSPFNYVILSYYKPVLMLTQLKESIGAYAFKELMNDFYHDWKFKHPYPEDVKTVFESETNKNLSWFFDDLVKNNKLIDYKIRSLRKTKGEANKYNVLVKNKTGVDAPFSLDVLNENQQVVSKIWYDGFKGKKTFSVNLSDSAYKIILNHGYGTTELYQTDNSSRIKGIFKKSQLPKLHFFYRFSNPEYSPIFYTPVLGWNIYNKWMPGIALYSDPVVLRNLDYVLNPMYSFSMNELVGSANVGYLIRPRNTFISTIRLGVIAQHFNYDYAQKNNFWTKIAPEIVVDFSTKIAENRFHQLRLRNVFIKRGVYFVDPVINSNGNFTGEYSVKKEIDYFVSNISYSIQKYHKINPWHSVFDVQFNKDFLKASMEFSGEHFYRKKSSFEYRVFAGKCHQNNLQFIPNPNFQAQGISPSYIGGNDYLFDYPMLGRSEMTGVLSHQMTMTEGGFKMATPLGVSDWIISFNTFISIPRVPIVKIFADIATFANAKQVLDNKEIFIYEAGLEFQLIKNTFEIFVPLLISKDLKRVSELNGQKWSDRIRFVLNLNSLNPFNYKKTIHNIAI